MADTEPRDAEGSTRSDAIAKGVLILIGALLGIPALLYLIMVVFFAVGCIVWHQCI